MPILKSVASATAARLHVLEAALASDPALWRLLAPIPDEYYRDANSVREFVNSAMSDAAADTAALEERLERLLGRVTAEDLGA
jgi:hypothetical protein